MRATKEIGSPPVRLKLNSLKIFEIEFGVFPTSLCKSQHPELYKFLKLKRHRDILGREIKFMPLLTTFGRDYQGSISSLHIHGYFPYFYIKPHPSQIPLFQNQNYLVKFARVLEKAIWTCFPSYSPFCQDRLVRKIVKPRKGSKNRKTQDPKQQKQQQQQKIHLIHNLSIVMLKDFYGYHHENQMFIKIEFYSESLRKKLTQILQMGVICNHTFQLYEAHIGVFMQFFSDCNLYGFAELNPLKSISRNSSPLFTPMNSEGIYSSQQPNPSIINQTPTLSSSYPRVTTCINEADCRFKDLINAMGKNFEMDMIESKEKSTKRNWMTYYKKLDNWSVQITQVLNDIWVDENTRRRDNGMEKIPDWNVSTIRNIESSLEEGGDNMLHSNQFWKVKDDIEDSIAAFQAQEEEPVFIDLLEPKIEEKVAKNFWNKLKRIDKVNKVASNARFKVYGARKKKEKKRQVYVDKLEIGFSDSDSSEKNNENQNNLEDGYEDGLFVPMKMEVRELKKVNKKFIKNSYVDNKLKFRQKKLDILFRDMSKAMRGNSSNNEDNGRTLCMEEEREKKVQNFLKNKNYIFKMKPPTSQQVKLDLEGSCSFKFYQQ